MKIKALIISLLTIFTINSASAQNLELGWQVGYDVGSAFGGQVLLRQSLYGGISINENLNLDLGLDTNFTIGDEDERYPHGSGIAVFAKGTYYPIIRSTVLPYISLAIGPNISSKHTGLYLNTSIGATWYVSRIMGLNFGIGFLLCDLPYKVKRYDYDGNSYVPDLPPTSGDTLCGFAINVGLVFGTSKWY